MRSRMFAILAVVTLAFAVIGGRLVDIQLVSAARYDRYASGEDIRTTSLTALRGSILDRTGQPLAISELRPTIIGDPHQVTNPSSEAATLSPILHISPTILDSELSQDDGFVYLAHDEPSAVGTAVSKLDLPGVSIQQTPERFYPAGQLALPLLGSLNAAGTGVSGLEYAENHTLTGTPGRLVEQVDPQGQPVPGGVIQDRPPVLGGDVVLSLDDTLQYQTEQALGQAIVADHSRSGIAMVMNAHTGGLLAVAELSAAQSTSAVPALPVAIGSRGQILAAGAPATVPQPVESSSADAFTQVYEPGSIEKLITVSAALATGAISPSETFTIPDTYEVAGTPFHDAETHPTERLSVTGILAQSSNIGAIQIAQRLGAPALYRYLAAYGLGSPTPVKFPGQSSGIITPRSELSGTSLATMAFGQGIAVTAAQMLSAYNAVADGGTYVAPHIVDGVIGPNGHEQPATHPAPRRVVPASVARDMTGMLEQVVAAGTGTAAAVAPYAVAGKTGTAYLSGTGGYVPGRYVASFAGFAPAQHPAVTVMVMIDDTTDFGAQASAPAFAIITRDALNDLKIPPAGPQPSPAPAAIPQAAAIAGTPHRTP